MRPSLLNPLFAPLSSLDGVGPRIETNLSRLLRGGDGTNTAVVADLLFHLPTHIIDRRNQPEITKAPEGAIVTLKVRVDRHQPPPRGNKKMPYRVFVHDDSGELALVYFRGQSNWLQKSLPVDATRFVSGKIEWFNGRPTMVHPDYVIAEEDIGSFPMVEPVYPSTAGISAKILNKAVQSALSRLPDLPEWQAEWMQEKFRWQSINEALNTIHAPRDVLDVDPENPTWKRLAFDELLCGQLALALVRNSMKKASGQARKGTGEIKQQILSALPFKLTQSQIHSLDEIVSDLETPERMLRLLQGDVGSGKTIVALMAMAHAVESGGQAALMAPTEILARQHLATLSPLCAQAGIRIGILTGREKGKERQSIYASLANGEIDIVVGTHALFQSAVVFKNLALGIIDEQHRFGVHQRLALSAKGTATDILVMTATPIPRTLVLTFFGDMDVSQLTEKPPGRQTIQTNAMPIERLADLIGRMRKAVSDGEKIYWICPLVEESDELPVTAAEDRYAALQKVFGETVGLVHGRMKSTEKDAAMMAFKQGKTRILVATTVVEVGVDVPDATIMVIEHAERFGLSQLHQLRGRIGRGEKPSNCLLLYKSPLGETAQSRINIMRETDDGFLIAEKDLQLRGEGEILGTRQSGTPGFLIARMELHGDLLEIARDDARMIIAENPNLEGKRGDALRTALYLFGKDEAIKLLRAG